MRHRICRLLTAWLLATTMLCNALVPTAAIDRVSVTIGSGGGVGAYLSSASFSRSPSTGSGSLAPGILELLVDDRRGTSSGWQISLASAGLSGTTSSGVASLALTRSGPPFMIAGQSVIPAGPIARGGPGWPLAATQCVLIASAGSGSGVYGQRIGVLASNPDGTPIETMTGDIIVTIGSAP